MRGHLLLVVCGATLGVGALGVAATAAYAAPPPTSSAAVVGSPALVVPANYRPSFSANSVAPSANGLVTVAPGSAIDITQKSRESTPELAPKPQPSTSTASTGNDTAKQVPPTTSTTAPPSGQGSSGDEGSANDGNDTNNKGDGSNKGKGSNKGSGSNSGNDVNNKGDGSNKGKGKSGN
jgi:hypothetical protein